MLYTWILFTILGVAAASPVDVTKIRDALMTGDMVARNSMLENLILGLLDDLRKTMVTGSDDIPVLDPFELDHIHLDDQVIPVPGAHVTVNDLELVNLSSFVVDCLNVNMESLFLQRYRLKFDIHVPVLEANVAYYDLNVNVMIAKIFGEGDGNVSLIEPRVEGSLLLAPSFSIGSGLYFNIIESEVKFSLEDFDSHINGLLNDDSLSDFINTFLKNLVPELVELYEPQITKFLSDLVMEVGNDLLDDINLGSIFG